MFSPHLDNVLPANRQIEFRAGLNAKEIHKLKLKGVLHPGIVRASSDLTLNFARIEKCQKRRWHYFSILSGVCFLTFFDRGETERARPFPLFSHKPHAKQDHMGVPQMAI